MVQELHMPDTVSVKTENSLTSEQKELLLWEYYEKIKIYQENKDGTLPIQERYK
jgi:hypothetical protein